MSTESVVEVLKKYLEQYLRTQLSDLSPNAVHEMEQLFNEIYQTAAAKIVEHIEFRSFLDAIETVPSVANIGGVNALSSGDENLRSNGRVDLNPLMRNNQPRNANFDDNIGNETLTNEIERNSIPFDKPSEPIVSILLDSTIQEENEDSYAE